MCGMSMWVGFSRGACGSIAVPFAVSASLILVTMGSAMNYSLRSNAQSKLQDITDSAALYGAGIHDTDRSKRVDGVKSMIDANGIGVSQTADLAKDAKIRFRDNDNYTEVELTYDFDPVFPIGVASKPIRLEAIARANYPTKEVPDVSVVFVLDVSSSMEDTAGSTVTKIEALKTAVGTFIDEVENSSPDIALAEESIRFGLVAYDFDIEYETPLSWGWSAVERDAERMETGSGTDSSIGLAWANNALANDRLHRASVDPTYDASELDEFVVLITDGNNYSSTRDSNSKASCDAMKARGVIVHSVAVAAPPEGIAMLQNCASVSEGLESEPLSVQTAAYMHDAQNTTQLVEVFKTIGASVVQGHTRLSR